MSSAIFAAIFGASIGSSISRSSKKGPHVCVTSEQFFDSLFLLVFGFIGLFVMFKCMYNVYHLARDKYVLSAEQYRKKVIFVLVVFFSTFVLVPLIVMCVLKPIYLANTPYWACAHRQ